MATPFAALEDRMNAVIDKKLANATADFGGGVTVDGVFSSVFVEQHGVEGMKPAFNAIDESIPALTHSSTVTIKAVAYRVVGIQPDAGRTTLLLEKA